MRYLLINLFLLTVLLVPAPEAEAKCTDDEMMNFIEDPAWDCIFPVSIMGIPYDQGDHPPSDYRKEPFCECPGKALVGFGFTVSFWEPAVMIETVNDAFCFPGLGLSLDVSNAGLGYAGGGQYRIDDSNIAFQNYHYYTMPLWAILDLFTDIPCITESGLQEFDLSMVSELRPEWGNDLYALLLFPETVLMANPATVLACAADALATTAQRPIDALYWCIGSWGLTYPATGHITARDYVAANAGIASRALFVQARTLNLPDRAVNYCSAMKLPIWVKSHWRIQEVDPAVDNRCHAIGHAGILWTQRKNPVGRQDNFAWMLFRKVDCCVVLF